MIKLCIENATLATLDPALLPFVQWKGLKVSDMEGVSDEVLSQNLFKMNKAVIKALIKNQRVNTSSIEDTDWYEIAREMYSNGDNLFDYVQLPYKTLKYIISQRTSFQRMIASTQHAYPVQESVNSIDINSLNHVLYKNSLPALTDYIFTDEGAKHLKNAIGRNICNLTFITTDEAKKLGLEGNAVRNRTISVSILNRAGACEQGRNYCGRILRELGVESITWDEAIKTIRSNPKLQNRDSLKDYMEWIRTNRAV